MFDPPNGDNGNPKPGVHQAVVDAALEVVRREELQAYQGGASASPALGDQILYADGAAERIHNFVANRGSRSGLRLN